MCPALILSLLGNSGVAQGTLGQCHCLRSLLAHLVSIGLRGVRVRFKIPKSLSVSGYRIAVRRVEEEGYWGTASIDEQTLHLSPRASGHRLQDTLLHELIHLVNRATVCGLSEAQVGRLATGLSAVIEQLEAEDARPV